MVSAIIIAFISVGICQTIQINGQRLPEDKRFTYSILLTLILTFVQNCL